MSGAARSLGGAVAKPPDSTRDGETDQIPMTLLTRIMTEDSQVPSPAPAPARLGRIAWEETLNWADAQLGVRLARVLLPCVAASLAATGIVTVEMFFGGRHRQWYLVLNLGLAWIPLGFAWLAWRRAATTGCKGPAFWGLSAAWLLFFPNAPYILTDLVHLLGKSLPHYWPDMAKILLFGITGMMTGMLSLQLMHGVVASRRGWIQGWGFVAAVSVLASIGVSLGRFRRWNSWDALHDPQGILRDAFDLTRSPHVQNPTGWFFLLLALLIFCSYGMFYALRYAPPHEEPSPPAPTGPAGGKPGDDPAAGPGPEV
ncbi:MAG TPA: hypothetical protein DCM86_12345 [Verrucomicrobiales bacterium]|nr:hypothetical protein [Verrucomicrobiales bacterium]